MAVSATFVTGKKEVKMTNEEKINNSLDTVEYLAKQGFNDKEIALKLEISYPSFRKIKSQNEGLKRAIATGRDQAVRDIEHSLYKKAKGFKYKEQQAIKKKVDKLTEQGILTEEVVEVVTVEKYSPPDVTAMKFYLLNRAPKDWKNDPHKTANDKALLDMKKKEAKEKEKMMKEWNDSNDI